MSLGLPGAATANYLLTNPGPDTPVVQDIPGATIALRIAGARLQRRRVHGQQALREQLVADLVVPLVAADRATSRASSATTTASPIRASRRSTTTRPTIRRYTTIGVPLFGYTGDIRFLGTAGDGPLPLDRTHDVKAVWHLRVRRWG